MYLFIEYNSLLESCDTAVNVPVNESREPYMGKISLTLYLKCMVVHRWHIVGDITQVLLQNPNHFLTERANDGFSM